MNSERAILAHMRHVTPPRALCNAHALMLSSSTHAYLRSHSVSTCSQLGIDTHRRSAETRMEECPSGADYASGKGDPSESDTPPTIRTPKPAGEQAQGSAHGKCERSQLACCAFSRSMTHTWSRLTLQASSDIARLSSLCVITPGVSRGDDASQAASHSPELKRKKDSPTTSGETDGSVRTSAS